MKYVHTVPGWRLSAANNLREHPMVRAKRVKNERATAALMFHVWRGLKNVERVHFVRIAPRELDEGDNLTSAFKGIRDELARMFGVNDNRKGGVSWTYDQEKPTEPKTYAVRVEVTTRDA